MTIIFKMKKWPDHVKPKLRFVFDVGEEIKLFVFLEPGVFIYTSKTNLRKLPCGGIDMFLKKNNNLELIYNFFILLRLIQDPNTESKLKSLCKKSDIVEWGGDDLEEIGYFISNVVSDNYMLSNDYINFGYGISEYKFPRLRKEELTWNGKITYQEFYLLMQIYFGLYEEEEYKKELEKKEVDGYYDDIKNYMNSWEEWVRDKQKEEDKKGFFQKKRKYSYKDYEKEFIPLGEVQEYSKLCLMRQDISGAFDGLEIEKIFDKSWCRERQKKQIDMINKEFGEEVIIWL